MNEMAILGGAVSQLQVFEIPCTPGRNTGGED